MITVILIGIGLAVIYAYSKRKPVEAVMPEPADKIFSESQREISRIMDEVTDVPPPTVFDKVTPVPETPQPEEPSVAVERIVEKLAEEVPIGEVEVELPGGIVIDGIITDAKTGLPVDNVRIAIFSREFNEATYTDAAGHYSMEISTGEYVVFAQKLYYFGQYIYGGQEPAPFYSYIFESITSSTRRNVALEPTR